MRGRDGERQDGRGRSAKVGRFTRDRGHLARSLSVDIKVLHWLGELCKYNDSVY